MALIKCPECSRQVSDKAPACPQCGYPVAEALSPTVPNGAAATTGMSQSQEAKPQAVSRPSPFKEPPPSSPVSAVASPARSTSGNRASLPQPTCQSPSTGRDPFAGTASRDGDRGVDELREIALRQRFLNYVLVIYLITGIPIVLMSLVPSVAVLALLGALTNTGFQIWCVFRLGHAMKLPLPWVWAATMFMPCIKLVFLLIIDGMASSTLRKAGIHVGFMGASPNSI